jgi:glycosyltransferase involved in cell wall biosynthesis
MTSAAPLRIAQLSPLWTRIPPATYGGVELLIKLLVDELVARGHEVTLFATGDCDTKARLHAVCRTNLCELIESGEACMFEYYANALMTDVLRRVGEFDIIHSHLAPAWLPLGALSPTPVLWTMHTLALCDDDWALQRYPSVEVAGISEAQMRGPAGRIGRQFPIVYNGCDFDAFDPCFEPGEYLAFIGRMSRAKNPLGAIRIAKEVGLPIVLAGQPQNADEQRWFANEVKPLIDGSAVRWIGPANHRQKNELLRHASALLFPIEWDEPFGLVMIEAMACGCPVVAHRRGSVPEVIDEGVTGFHSEAMEDVAGLVPRALALDRAAVRDRARDRFSHRTMVDSYLKLYRTVASRACY